MNLLFFLGGMPALVAPVFSALKALPKFFYLIVVLAVRGDWLIRAEPVCIMLALLRWFVMTER